MGFQMRWDVPQIISELKAAAAETASPYNDGFTAWHCKQDLLQVKYALEHMLKDLPTFAEESQYIQELEKQQVWHALSKK
jgi:hypothetical protein